MYQQGDVLIFAINEVPKSATKQSRTERGYILAEGEVTGHAHVIDANIDFYRDNSGQLFFRTADEVTIRHEEHGPITVPPGSYRVATVQEYDYDDEAAKNVVD